MVISKNAPQVFFDGVQMRIKEMYQLGLAGDC